MQPLDPMFNLHPKVIRALLEAGAIAVASVAVAGSAAGDEQPDRSFLATLANTGFYAAAALGRTSSQVNLGSAAHTAPYEISGNPLGLQLGAGYRPVPAWSGEVSYVRLGRISSGPSDATLDGLLLSALGYLPTPLVTLYGRAGIFDARTYGVYDVAAAPRAVPIHHHDSNLAFGVGLSTNFHNNINLRLESQGFQVTHTKNTSLFSIAWVWSFL